MCWLTHVWGFSLVVTSGYGCQCLLLAIIVERGHRDPKKRKSDIGDEFLWAIKTATL